MITKRPSYASVLLAMASLNFGVAHADNSPPYFGLGQQRYDECVALGSSVINAQRVKPDSPQHESAYSAWNQKCGMSVMLPLVKKYGLGNVPTSPLDWSKIK